MVGNANIIIPKVDNTAQILVGVAVIGAVGGAAYLLYKLISPLSQGVQGASNTISGVGQNLVKATGGVAQGVSDIGTGTGQLVVKVENATGDASAQLIGQTGASTTQIVHDAGNLTSGVIGVGQTAVNATNTGVGNIGSGINNFTSEFNTLTGKLTNGFNNVLDEAGKQLQNPISIFIPRQIFGVQA